ncbi:PIN domain-containing protein [Sciscionella marina]|uniref:PIN domain-containing protein n=1 Tax=Sciscionella marina TaxID=508770 RepID=UPI000380C3A4|nr:PIN domain-containing protein [Sciscionella marina]
MSALAEEERIALFLDYENLAIGARDGLGVQPFDFTPVADALAERGRVVARKAYADWSSFDADRRLLTRAQVELIEIPQRVGGSRKNAADIKMAVDAVEMVYERGFVTTFAIGTGDSDFTPLMHKLRSLDKRVIGIGVQSSTSALLPAACDEFLFYDRLPGVEPTRPREYDAVAGTRIPQAEAAEPVATGLDEQQVGVLVASTLAGLLRHADGPVFASVLKRAVLRKDPTFDEAEQGFRGFGELLRQLDQEGVLQLSAGAAPGDPQVTFPENDAAEQDAFSLLVDVVRGLQSNTGAPQLSGLKNQLRKQLPGFSEKRYGFNSFLSFAKASKARGLLTMEWDRNLGDYVLRAPE